MIEVVLSLGLVILCVVVVNIYFAWVRRECPDPVVINECPVCPPSRSCPDVDAILRKKNDNLSMMVRYLTLIIKKFDAEKELYRLSSGHHRVYNSPKVEYLKKEIYRMIKRIKLDSGSTLFFERNLNNMID